MRTPKRIGERLKSLESEGVDTEQAAMQLSRPIGLPILVVPVNLGLRTVEMDQAMLRVITWYDDSFKMMTAPARSCLEDFLKLAEATDEEVLEFCRARGVLKLGTQIKDWGDPVGPEELAAEWRDIINKPESYPPELVDAAGQTIEMYDQDSASVPGGRIRDPRQWSYEPVELYRLYSRQAMAFLSARVDLADGKTARFEDWQTIFRPERPEAFQWPPELLPAPDLETQKYLFGDALTGWLKKSDARPILCWGEGGKPPLLKVDGARRSVNPEPDKNRKFCDAQYSLLRHMGQPTENLHPRASTFTAIVLQIVAAVTSSAPGFDSGGQGYPARCSVCGEIYFSKKRLRADRANLCDDKVRDCRAERHREKARDSNRRKRNKMKGTVPE